MKCFGGEPLDPLRWMQDAPDDGRQAVGTYQQITMDVAARGMQRDAIAAQRESNGLTIPEYLTADGQSPFRPRLDFFDEGPRGSNNAAG